MSVIVSLVPPVAEEITQSADQVKRRLITQLIIRNSRVFQKLLKYCNGTAILVFLVLPAAGVFPAFITRLVPVILP